MPYQGLSVATHNQKVHQSSLVHVGEQTVGYCAEHRKREVHVLGGAASDQDVVASVAAHVAAVGVMVVGSVVVVVAAAAANVVAARHLQQDDVHADKAPKYGHTALTFGDDARKQVSMAAQRSQSIGCPGYPDQSQPCPFHSLPYIGCPSVHRVEAARRLAEIFPCCPQIEVE